MFISQSAVLIIHKTLNHKEIYMLKICLNGLKDNEMLFTVLKHSVTME